MAKGNGRKMQQGRVSLGVRKRVCPESVVRHWDKLPMAVGMARSLLEFRKCFGNAQTSGLIFGWSCVETGVGLYNPCGALSAQDIL